LAISLTYTAPSSLCRYGGHPTSSPSAPFFCVFQAEGKLRAGGAAAYASKLKLKNEDAVVRVC
jgi:hypothetical protein